jgi:hypothetical protein
MIRQIPIVAIMKEHGSVDGPAALHPPPKPCFSAFDWQNFHWRQSRWPLVTGQRANEVQRFVVLRHVAAIQVVRRQPVGGVTTELGGEGATDLTCGNVPTKFKARPGASSLAI